MIKMCPCGRGPRSGKNSYRKCLACLKEQRAKREKPAPAEPDFEITVEEPTPPTPLEQAYKTAEDRSIAAQTRKQRDALLEENIELKRQLRFVDTIAVAPDILIYDKAKPDRFDAIACALASDWHVEEEVVKESVHGLNQYNLDVARSRAQMFFQNLLRLTDIHARDSKITHIWIGFLGDFFSGHIHEELMASTLLAPGDAANFVKELLCSGIDFLLRESSYVITGDMIPGNHGRMTKQMWFSNPTGTSLETFMYRYVADRYRDNPRVQLNVSDHHMVYRQLFPNFTMRLIHGYEMKFGGGVGGITIPVRKAISQWDIAIPAQLTCFGHFHQRIDGGNFVGNGSLIGYNTYAQNIKAGFERPVQCYFNVHARHGGEKTIVAPIWLEK